MKEPGCFSKNYLFRKAKKDDHIHKNYSTTEEMDFPLAYTTSKSVNRSSISQKKYPTQEQKKKQEETKEIIHKQEQEIKYLKQQLKNNSRQLNLKVIQYENYIKDIKQEQESKENQIALQIKQTKELLKKINRYSQSIKTFVIWLLKMFTVVENGKKIHQEDLQHEIKEIFHHYIPYIEELKIQREVMAACWLQEQSNQSSLFMGLQENTHQATQKNRSKVDADQEHLNMAKILEMAPFLDTFNNNQQEKFESKSNSHDKIERITKKLFDSSEKENTCMNLKNRSKSKRQKSDLSHYSQSKLKIQENKEYSNAKIVAKNAVQVPCDATICKNFMPASGQQNYLELKNGQKVKLLRNIRNTLWVGEYGEKIGYVLQEYLIL